MENEHCQFKVEDAVRGYYYLHENGDLIFKRTEPELEVGGFVKRVWPINNWRGSGWKIAVEALALGANRERIRELEEKWGLTNEDGLVYAGVIGLQVEKVEISPHRIAWKIEIRRGGGPFGRSAHFLGESVLEALAEYVRGGGVLP